MYFWPLQCNVIVIVISKKVFKKNTHTHIYKLYATLCFSGRTYNVDESQELTEEISEGPEVVVLEVRVEVVQDQLLLQSFLRLRDDPQVQVHR